MNVLEVRARLAEAVKQKFQEHTKTVVKMVGDPKTGTEVGVAWGWNSAALLLDYPNLTLNMVDYYWKFPPEHPYNHANDIVGNSPQSFLDTMMYHALDITDFAEKRRRFFRMTSAEAALRVSEASQDFVFVDADHTYDSVMYDLIAWYPKVRPGGIIFGHDYGLWGVKDATDKFFAHMGTHVKLHPHTIWSVTKPEKKWKHF